MVSGSGTMVNRFRYSPVRRLAALAGGFLAAMAWGSATVTMQTMFGVLTDTTGTPVPDGALWVMIYDQNDDGRFPGGLETDGTLLDPAAAHAAFAGKILEVGNIIEGDRIFALGEINDLTGGYPGLTQNRVVGLDIVGMNLEPGRKWAFYWFPGLTTANPQLPGQSFEIGGINEVSQISSNSDQGMTIPNDGALVNIYIYANSVPEGTLPTSRFRSVAAEPTNDFAAWIAGFFPGESDPVIVGFDADPDADGLANGLESFLGTPPDVPSPGLESPASVSPGTLTFLVTLAKEPPSDVTGKWEWSRDLVHWFPDGASDGSVVVDFTETIVDGINPVRNRMKIAATGSDSSPLTLFVRLVATQ